jgi:hypothetical protein
MHDVTRFSERPRQSSIRKASTGAEFERVFVDWLKPAGEV